MTYIQLGVEILWGNELLPNALFCVPQDSTTHSHANTSHGSGSEYLIPHPFGHVLKLVNPVRGSKPTFGAQPFHDMSELQPLQHHPKHMRITGRTLLRQGLGGANGNHKLRHFYLAWSHDLGVSYCHS